MSNSCLLFDSLWVPYLYFNYPFHLENYSHPMDIINLGGMCIAFIYRNRYPWISADCIRIAMDGVWGVRNPHLLYVTKIAFAEILFNGFA